MSDYDPQKGRDFSRDIRYGTSDTWDPNNPWKETDTFGAARTELGNRELNALGRSGVQVDTSGANASLAQAAMMRQQYDQDLATSRQAASMLQGQSLGAYPSAASIGASLGSQQSLQASLSALSGGRSSLANAALARQALTANSLGQLQNAQNAGAARAQELSLANSAWANQAAANQAANTAMAGNMTKRGGIEADLGFAQAKQNLAQQQLNQQYAQQQEQMLYALGQTQRAGTLDTLKRSYGQQAVDNQLSEAAAQRAFQYIGAGTQAAGTIGAAYATSGAKSSDPGSSNSDERTKQGAWDVLPLYEPEGMQLQQDAGTGRAYYQAAPSEQPSLSTASLRGAPSLAEIVIAEPPRTATKQAPAKRREMTYDEMLAAANALEKQQKSYYADLMARPTAVQSAMAPDQGVLADANRKMAGSPYRYKPEFTPPDEVPGQIHHGFMAQSLELNPITATAVQEGPDGMKRVHHARMLQAVASGLSDLQRQVDDTRQAMALRKAGR